jgi:predicted type IV restriction endonuclease
MLPVALQTLIAKFQSNIEDYKHSSYNEAQLRREFLDKFIKILGWDA